jgi:DNA-binding NarL/FixJ family response regulator
MPRLPGLEAMRAIMTKSPRVKIVLLTSTISTQQIIEALQIGARGIVLKDSVVGDLPGAARRAGRRLLDRRRARRQPAEGAAGAAGSRPPPSPSARPTA